MNSIKISIYFDESKNRRDKNGDLWDYYCMLIIPKEKEELLFKNF